jgi:membrane associated rhomboid family serine protease
MSGLSLRWQQLKQARGSWVLVGLLVMVHGAFVVLGHADFWWETCGLNREALLQGRVWTLLTYGFFHGNAAHLLTNVAMILLLGSRLEWILGTKKLVLAFVLGIIGGGLGHLLLVPGDALLIGASGAAMSFLLLFCVLDPYARCIPLPLHARNIGAGVLVSSLFFAVINPSLGLKMFAATGVWISQYLGSGIFAVGHACHFSGALAGLAIGKWWMRLRHSRASILAERERNDRAEK